MTTKAKVGYVGGTRLQPTVGITVWDDAGATLTYDAALAAALSAAPSSILNARLNSTDPAITERSDYAYTFEMTYGRKQSVTLTRNINSDTAPRKIYDWIAPLGVVDATGDVTSSYPHLKRRLNRMGSMFEYDSNKPVIRDPLKETLTLAYTALSSNIDDDYVRRVTDMVDNGVFNNAPFWNYSAGELQLVSFTASEQTDGGWQLSYGMGIRYNETSVSVGPGILIDYLRGCDDWWPIREEVFTSGQMQMRTKAVVYGQLWELDDFTALELPWQGYLSTRTNDTSGVITTLYPHDLDNLDSMYLYWEGGYRLSTDVSSVGVSTITFNSGNGDVLPAVGTRVLAAKG